VAAAPATGGGTRQHDRTMGRKINGILWWSCKAKRIMSNERPSAHACLDAVENPVAFEWPLALSHTTAVPPLPTEQGARSQRTSFCARLLSPLRPFLPLPTRAMTPGLFVSCCLALRWRRVWNRGGWPSFCCLLAAPEEEAQEIQDAKQMDAEVAFSLWCSLACL
jgi:hypothetical protein